MFSQILNQASVWSVSFSFLWRKAYSLLWINCLRPPQTPIAQSFLLNVCVKLQLVKQWLTLRWHCLDKLSKRCASLFINYNSMHCRRAIHCVTRVHGTNEFNYYVGPVCAKKQITHTLNENEHHLPFYQRTSAAGIGRKSVDALSAL